MKTFTTFIFVIVISSTNIFGQDSYRLGLFLGYSQTSPTVDDDLYISKMYSVEYQKRIYPIVAVTGGISYESQVVKFDENRFMLAGPSSIASSNQNLISIYGNFKGYMFYSKYFYIYLGIVLDFELCTVNNPAYNHQDGLGTNLGLGFELPINSYVIYLEPLSRFRRIVRFKTNELIDTEDELPIFNFGVRLGFSYKFF